MKIFQAMEAARGRQVPVIPRFARMEADCSGALPDPKGHPNRFLWRYGVQLYCMFVGPEEAEEHLAQQARRMIAREVYGDVRDDLFELMRLLTEENYRASDDPVMAHITGMLQKMAGD
jgi:hypothetical protein